MRFRIVSYILAALISFIGINYFQNRGGSFLRMTEYSKEIQEFHQKAEERLRSPEGWLTVVGLIWLKPGDNTVGSAKGADVGLPTSVPAEFAKISMDKKQNTKLAFSSAALQTSEWATVNDKPAEKGKSYDLADDTTDNPTKIKYGTITFFTIKRKNGMGVRVRDTEAETRKNFKGREWYSTKQSLRIEAEWIAHKEPKTIQIPDILGNLNDEKSPGYARFQLDGKTVELHPTQEDDTLFYVFRDQTSGKESYGASRFLYTSLPKDGHVILDFNKAVNPPCAFTNFATCPMPPPENIIPVAIAAGEKKPLNHLH